MSERDPGYLARLTQGALRSAEAEGLLDVRCVAESLYRFNSVAPSSHWERRYPDRESTATALGVGRGTASRAQLEERWLEGSGSGWWTWTARPTGDELGCAGPEFKLYVSPAIEALRPAFEGLLELLSTSRARAFKVGTNATYLLRPDKIVLYFSDLCDLTSTAHRLADRLRRIAAQGVPFTSEIACGGLLSWSVDPPACRRVASEPPLSWRTWVTRRAAHALVAAQREAEPQIEPWRRALELLRREGVDTENWRAAPAQWASLDAWR